MALSQNLTGDIFRRITEQKPGSQSLFDVFLGNKFGGFGGLFSPQSRALRPRFDQMFSQYLGEILGRSPEVGMTPQFPGRQGTSEPTSFLDFLKTTDLSQVFRSLTPSQRGEQGARFNPIVRRIR
jgi:hypothetical protein